MENLINIQQQIENLQKKAKEIKAKEYDKTIRDILSTMQAFGITVRDLQAASSKKKPGAAPGGRARAARPRSAKSAIGRTVAPKFRGPHGETWTGRGLMPRWLSALVAQGRKKEEFEIGS